MVLPRADEPNWPAVRFQAAAAAEKCNWACGELVANSGRSAVLVEEHMLGQHARHQSACRPKHHRGLVITQFDRAPKFKPFPGGQDGCCAHNSSTAVGPAAHKHKPHTKVLTNSPARARQAFLSSRQATCALALTCARPPGPQPQGPLSAQPPHTRSPGAGAPARAAAHPTARQCWWPQPARGSR